MKKIKHIILGILISVSVFAVVSPVTAQAASPVGLRSFAACTPGRVLTFPAWYNGLTIDQTTCSVQLTKLTDIWKIVLNVVEILIQIAGYLAAGFILWGGFKYIKSQGNPQNIASAKSTIMNAAIGLGIALSAVAIVNFVSGRF